MISHYCVTHKTAWFKKGKMKGYAHPIVNDEGEPTGQWCNEPEEETLPVGTAQKEAVMSRDDWAKKDKITRKSIERQKSIECAVMLCQSAQIESDEILAYAKTFEEFIGRAL